MHRELKNKQTNKQDFSVFWDYLIGLIVTADPNQTVL